MGFVAQAQDWGALTIFSLVRGWEGGSGLGGRHHLQPGAWVGGGGGWG